MNTYEIAQSIHTVMAIIRSYREVSFLFPRKTIKEAKKMGRMHRDIVLGNNGQYSISIQGKPTREMQLIAPRAISVLFFAKRVENSKYMFKGKTMPIRTKFAALAAKGIEESDSSDVRQTIMCQAEG